MKIIAVAGASGGHIFPAISFLDAFRRAHPDAETLLVLPEKNIYSASLPQERRIACLDIEHFSSSKGLKNIPVFLKAIKGFFDSRRVIRAFGADAVVGFGSMISVPMALAAKSLKRKIFIHEQNVIPGKANRFIARFADKIGVAFEETRPYFSGFGKKVFVVGNPLRPSIVPLDKQKALDFFGFGNKAATLLITGGSQGSRRINRAVIDALCRQERSRGLQVIHITGVEDNSEILKAYEACGITAKAFKFLAEMEYAYSACDVAIARSGAITVAELIRFSIPAILIPYPYAAGHQKANALVLGKRGAAVVIEEDSLNVDMLAGLITEVIGNEQTRERMRNGYKDFLCFEPERLLVESVSSLF